MAGSETGLGLHYLRYSAVIWCLRGMARSDTKDHRCSARGEKPSSPGRRFCYWNEHRTNQLAADQSEVSHRHLLHLQRRALSDELGAMAESRARTKLAATRVV